MTGAKLAICISTRNREAYIEQTLRSILDQADARVEVVVVDGASTDRTPDVVRSLTSEYPHLRLVELTTNGGLDADFDRAVEEARADYCWLFSDDDLIVPGAIDRVLLELAENPMVVVVDAEVRGPDMSRAYQPRRLSFQGKRTYPEGRTPEFFADCVRHLSFIGCLIVRREFWLSRERRRYFGSYFIHVGVLFQDRIPGSVVVLGESLVQIRYGLASWSSRTFEIWMFKWPELLWSFEWIPEEVRRTANPRFPWKTPQRLIALKAIGAYDAATYRDIVRPRTRGILDRLVPFLAQAVPGHLAYGLTRVAARLRDPNDFIHFSLDQSRYRWGPR